MVCNSTLCLFVFLRAIPILIRWNGLAAIQNIIDCRLANFLVNYSEFAEIEYRWILFNHPHTPRMEGLTTQRTCIALCRCLKPGHNLLGRFTCKRQNQDARGRHSLIKQILGTCDYGASFSRAAPASTSRFRPSKVAAAACCSFSSDQISLLLSKFLLIGCVATHVAF